MRFTDPNNEQRGPEGLTRAQEELCQLLWAVGAVTLERQRNLVSQRGGVNIGLPDAWVKVDAEKADDNPELKEAAVRELIHLLEGELLLDSTHMIGVPDGATQLGKELARRVGKVAIGARKLDDGNFEVPYAPGPPRNKVVIYEDVINTGKSVMRMVETLRGRGWEVVGVVCIVDWQKGDRRLLGDLSVQSVMTLHQLLSYLMNTVGDEQAERKLLKALNEDEAIRQYWVEQRQRVI